jgi:hypothetical protein
LQLHIQVSMRTEPNDIGKRLKQARESVDLSAGALSLKMSPSPGRSWWSAVEAGRITSPELATLKAAAVAAGVSDEWLLLGVGPMRKRSGRAA